MTKLNKGKTIVQNFQGKITNQIYKSTEIGLVSFVTKLNLVEYKKRMIFQNTKAQQKTYEGQRIATFH